jgi:multisubunit Na+/H+ antiporter MnhB subunit
MRIKSLSLGLSAGVITAIAFGICGVFFAIAPGPTTALVSWVLHLDVTGMTRPLSVMNLLAGIVLFGAYVGLLVGVTAALYNRLTTPRTT